MSDWAKDPVVVELREQISSADLVILETINQRLELVSRLRTYKQEHGYPFVDKAREDSLIAELTKANRGPLSAEGLRELYLGLLEIMKREAAAQNGNPL